MKKPKGFYALVVAVILITAFVFWATAYIPLLGYPSYMPLAVSAAYIHETGLVLCAPVLWLLLLFIPYGLLFDMLWRNRKAEGWHAFLTAFFLMLTYHIVGRCFHSDWGYTIDVPIGAGLGAVTGVCIRHINGTLRRKRQARETGAPDTRRLWLTNTWETAVLCMLAIAFGGTSFLQHVSPYGVSRIRYGAYPYDTLVSCSLPDMPESAAVYRKVLFDTNAIARQLADTFACDKIITLKNYDLVYDGPVIIVRNIDNHDRDIIMYQTKAGDLQKVDMSLHEGLTLARQALEPLLQEGETLYLENGDARPKADVIESVDFRVETSDPAVYPNNRIDGEVHFYGGRIASIYIELFRMKAAETIQLIPIAQQFERNRSLLPDVGCFDGQEYTVRKVERTEGYYGGKRILLPCYTFSGSYYYAGNSSYEDWHVTIDAVDRGILPYVVPGAIALVAMAAIGVSIRKRRDTMQTTKSRRERRLKSVDSN